MTQTKARRTQEAEELESQALHGLPPTDWSALNAELHLETNKNSFAIVHDFLRQTDRL